MIRKYIINKTKLKMGEFEEEQANKPTTILDLVRTF